MKAVASKIKFYGIFLWRKINSSPELMKYENLKPLVLHIDQATGFRVIIMTTANCNDQYRILASLQKNKIEKVG